MNRRTAAYAFLTAAALAGAVHAQPALISIGTGSIQGASNPQSGVTYFSGITGSQLTTRWTYNGSSITSAVASGTGGGKMSANGNILLTTVTNAAPNSLAGNTATGVTPPFSLSPTLTSSVLSATGTGPGVFNATTATASRVPAVLVDPAAMVYGPGASGSTIGFPYDISPNGNFVVGRMYISSYSTSAGTAITTNNGQWRGLVWDRTNNTARALPAPFRTVSGQTWRQRNVEAWDVSNDGNVVLGFQEHNTTGVAGPDPDGGRPLVYRWNGTAYTWSYLPGFINPSTGQATTTAQSNGSYQMNSLGTIIVGIGFDWANGGNSMMARWDWNATTQTWDGPTKLFSALEQPVSWLPLAVTNCNVPAQFFLSGMSDDASIVIGNARYSTCGSFMSAGFIYRSSTGTAVDFHDYLVSLNTPGISNWGPIGDNGDPTRGLPKLGTPIAISPDGTKMAGNVVGPQFIVGAQPWILDFTPPVGGCINTSISSNPPATATFSNCSFAGISLNVAAAGSGPFTYQWSKGGSPVSNGPTGNGSTITGANDFNLRIASPKPSDAGTYTCTITGACGTPVTSTACVVSTDATNGNAIVNDTCATATSIGEGTTAFNACGAYVLDTANVAPTCLPLGFSIHTDVWFRYVPTFTGNARIDTCGSNFDTLLAIYDSCGGGVIECNDDYFTGPTTSCSSTRSRIPRLSVTQGVPVYIRVSSFSTPGSTGSITITPNAPAAAANDTCGGAIALNPGTANPFDLTEASADPLLVPCNSSTNARDVWYSYTAPDRGRLRVFTCGLTTVNTVLSIHDACFSPSVACNDTAVAGDCGTGTSSQASIRDFITERDRTYYIRLAGNSSSTVGSGNIGLTFAPLSCNPADIACDDGTPLFPLTGCTNSALGPNEGDYNAFFAADGFFFQAGLGIGAVGLSCDIACDNGSPLVGNSGCTNNGVNEGDYNCFFNSLFNPCV